MPLGKSNHVSLVASLVTRVHKASTILNKLVPHVEEKIQHPEARDTSGQVSCMIKPVNN